MWESPGGKEEKVDNSTEARGRALSLNGEQRVGVTWPELEFYRDSAPC